MPWEKSYNKADMLDRAMRAFWARGYSATSIADLVEATGLNRGSLYAAYPDKRQLFVAALGHYDTHHRGGFLAKIAKDRGAREAIIAAFEAAATTGDTSPLPRGCLVVNTALELSPHDEEIRALVNQSLGEVERFFRDMILSAQDAGTISADKDATTTAKALLALFLGLRVVTRTTAEPAALTAIISQARMMLD